MGFNNNNNKIEKLIVNSNTDVIKILISKYRNINLTKCGRQRLENIVTHLVNISSCSNGRKENYRRPEWWPTELLFSRNLTDLKELIPDAVWNKVLRNLVIVFCDFYCEENRRNNRKRENHQTVLKEIQQKCLKPVVCLRDIFKPSCVSKDAFVKGLGLVPVEKHEEVNKALSGHARPVKFTFSSTVPFSSDYARVILKRDKIVSLEEAHLKRMERIERYLRNEDIVSQHNTIEYPVTYNKREELYCHIYKFPVKQAYQIQDRVTFLKSLCRPVSAIEERCDLPYKKKKVLKVVLTRLKITSAQLKRREKS